MLNNSNLNITKIKAKLISKVIKTFLAVVFLYLWCKDLKKLFIKDFMMIKNCVSFLYYLLNETNKQNLYLYSFKIRHSIFNAHNIYHQETYALLNLI